MTVLYADDDLEDFDFFREIVKELDPSTECVNVQSGLEAIEFLENARVLPDVVFLDINMPAQDGKGCLANIKRQRLLNALPVIMYTTSANEKDRQHCMQLGAFDYVSKPNSVDEAKKHLSKFFGVHKMASYYIRK